ncbi:LOW QUALITY PROTEIN: uncharacterized protein LOC132787648 [Drosophila nasuta]|uniref:LOW QUALITY PROTEIN: uncharacterized protein LOC132787648 n=1 Tax=Drosophila nasuta TaxID=42062 RepID=UPI00295F18D8|nr:LOW QUALITY PROTEIN: uncharacterized protein LOC132787648 [Drosophila nasuta]
MYLKVLVVLVLAGTVSAASAAAAGSLDNNLLHFKEQLEQLLDLSRSPCQDFYGYVCGRSANGNQTLRRQQEQQRFQQLLKSTNPVQMLDMELQLINFYKSCENNRGAEALRSSPLYKSSGGWPALEATTNNQSLHWLSVLGNFHEMGAPYFFETKISMQSNKRVVTLQPDTTRRHTMRKFEQRVGELLQGFGVEQSRAHVTSLEVLSLERSRRDIVKTERIDDQVQFSYMNFKRSSFGNASLNRLDWDGYFRKQLGGKTLQPTDAVVVKQLPRLVDYLLLLQNTSMHRLLNWLWIDYVMDIAAADCQQLVDTYAGDVYAHLLQRVSANRVQTTQMYAAIGRAYKTQLAGSVWIDEISEQASQRFLGQLMHMSLNGDERLNAAYHELQLGRRSFYRNMEKLRRFQHKRQSTSTTQQALWQYVQVFNTINGLLPQLQNLSSPLNYALIGERFARSLIAAGSNSRTPGAWRSMDSERQFAVFQNCSNTLSSERLPNANDLLLGMLAQRQSWSCYKQQLPQTSSRLNAQLGGGRMQLSLQRLYFIGSLLVECRENSGSSQQQQLLQRQLQHAILRNSVEFSEAFGCRNGDALYAQQQRCKLTP